MAIAGAVAHKKREPHTWWGSGLCLAAMPLLSLRAARRVPFAILVAATRGPSVLGGRRLFGFVFLRLMLAEHDLAVIVKRQSLQHYIEALAIFVRERNADVKPVVILLLPLDDRIDAIHLRHVGYSRTVFQIPANALLQSALEHSDVGERDRSALPAL